MNRIIDAIERVEITRFAAMHGCGGLTPKKKKGKF
jgi:hydroxylamine reductase (hybrid-cluster protein)